MHKHKFHSPFSDTILDIYRDKNSWKIAINWALARKSIRLRRDGRRESLAKALGVISYLKAFRQNVMTEKEREHLPFNLDNFVLSTREAVPLAISEEGRGIAPTVKRLCARFLTLSGVFVASINVIGKDSPLFGLQNSLFSDIIELSVDRVVYITSILVIMSIAFVIILPDRLPVRDKISANLARCAVCFPRKRFAVFEIFVGATIVLAGAALVLFGV